MKLKILFITLCVFSGTCLVAKSINKIVINDILGISFFSSYAILDGKLFFMERNSQNMWVTDGTKSGTHALKINNNPIVLFGFYTSMIHYHGAIYFINNSDGNTLWKTDGQTFNKISNKLLNTNPGLVIKNDSIVAYSQDKSELYQINDGGLNTLNIGGLSNPSISNMCLISTSNITLFGKENANDDYHLFQIIDGQKQIIAQDLLDSNQSINFSLIKNHTCFYQYSVNTSLNSRKYFALDDSGTVTLITTEIAGIQIDTWDTIIEFKNNIYFFPKFSNTSGTSSSLYEYTNNSVSALTNFAFNSTPNHVYASNNFLYANFSNPTNVIIDPIPPGGLSNYLAVFDDTFTFLNGFTISQFGSISQTLSYQGDSDMIIPTTSSTSIIPFIDNLTFLDDTQEVKVINTPHIKIIKAFGDEKNIYLIGFDRNNNNKTSIYIVKDEAVISHNLDGLWYSKDFDSQGLSIHTGTRQDGSEYMFASLYFYKGGIPFWIAGTSEIEVAPDATFSVYNYTGSSFLPGDPNQEIEKKLFATMTLESISCNKLNMELELLDGSIINLTLDRITNIKQRSCTD